MKPIDLILLALLFQKSLQLSLEETNSANMNLITQEIKNTFENGEGANIFIAALEQLPDGGASKEDIDKIVGEDYELVKKLWTMVRRKAIGLVTMKMEEIMPYFLSQNKNSKRIFADYFEMINFNLHPETIFLNRQIYDAYFNISEELFSEIYTRLENYYKLWEPLKVIIDDRKNDDFKEIKRIIELKNPDYAPVQIQTMGNMEFTSIEQSITKSVSEEPHENQSFALFNVKDGELSENNDELDPSGGIDLKSIDGLKAYSYLKEYRNSLRERNLQSTSHFISILPVILLLFVN